MKNNEDWHEARNEFHVYMRNFLMLKKLVLPKEHGAIEVHLSDSQ